MLLCPVCDCHLALARAPARVFCPRAHSFDIARSGYINLLQPQDRRSKLPGDSLAALASRRRLHDQGVTQPLLQAISDLAAPSANESVLDAGCGEGFYLGSLAKQSPLAAHGLDISVPAIESAARRYPDCEWIVANADRFIPYADESFSLILSITARMNPAEFRRVLRPDGRLLIALPAPNDLIELRGVTRDRVPRTLATFAPAFTLTTQRRITTTAALDAPSVHDALLSIYRPPSHPTTTARQVTLGLDLLLFRPTPAG